MRYLILVLLGIFSVIISGSFGLNIAGFEVDIILLIIVSVALLEKGVTPVLFAGLTGLFLDIMFSTVLGVNAFCYVIVAALVQMVVTRFRRVSFMIVFASGAGGYLLKEIIMGCLVYILGSRFSFGQVLVRSILPSALISGALLIVVYFLLGKLWNLSWMRPRVRHGSDDLGRI